MASGVPGFAREHAEVDADLLERPLVFAFGVLAEDQLGSAAQCSQPFWLISFSSWPGAQPA